jgi:tryptophanyl-tRNA synthetase
MLTDSSDDAAAKVMSATTDSVGSIKYDWENQPGITNLLQVLALVTDRPQTEVNAEWEGKTSYGELKSAVAEAVKELLADLQAKLINVDQDKMTHKLETSEQIMQQVANETLLKVQKAVGLRP